MALYHPAKVTRLNGRLLVHLSDDDGHDTYAHGLVLAPANINTPKKALAVIDHTFGNVVQADPEEWNYDDVIEALTKQGFEWIGPVYWSENEAG